MRTMNVQRFVVPRTPNIISASMLTPVVKKKNLHTKTDFAWTVNVFLFFAVLIQRISKIYQTPAGSVCLLSTMSFRDKKDLCRVCGGPLMGNQRRWLFGGQNKKSGMFPTKTESLRGGSPSRSLQSSPWGESGIWANYRRWSHTVFKS